MFSTIVVGTDGSETAGAAVALAVQLAHESGGKLHLVVGVRSPTAVSVPVGGVQAIDQSGGAHLRHVAERMLKNVAESIQGLDVKIHTAVGDPARNPSRDLRHFRFTSSEQSPLSPVG